MDTLIELLKLGTVGIIAGLFSLFLANKDHRNKKWWELRVTAYQQLIEALSDLNHYFNSMYKAEIEYHAIDEKEKNKLKKYWEKSFHKIRLAAESGALLYSDAVNESLKNLWI